VLLRSGVLYNPISIPNLAKTTLVALLTASKKITPNSKTIDAFNLI
jgi:hypothetical protein